MHHPLLPALLASAALLAASGCQKAADAATEAAIERASGQKVEINRDGNTLRIDTKEGGMTIATGDDLVLPADFPDDLFLPSNYAVSSVMDINGARLVSLESEGSLTSAFDAARSTMERSGWSQTLAMQQADSAMLGFSRDGRVANYTFTRRGEEQVMVGIQLRDAEEKQ